MTPTPFPALTFQPDTARLADARNSGIVIFGCGNFARDLLRAAERIGLTVHGFVVSAGQPTTYATLPVATLADLPAALLALPL